MLKLLVESTGHNVTTRFEKVVLGDDHHLSDKELFGLLADFFETPHTGGPYMAFINLLTEFESRGWDISDDVDHWIRHRGEEVSLPNKQLCPTCKGSRTIGGPDSGGYRICPHCSGNKWIDA